MTTGDIMSFVLSQIAITGPAAVRGVSHRSASSEVFVPTPVALLMQIEDGQSLSDATFIRPVSE